MRLYQHAMLTQPLGSAYHYDYNTHAHSESSINIANSGDGLSTRQTTTLMCIYNNRHPTPAVQSSNVGKRKDQPSLGPSLTDSDDDDTDDALMIFWWTTTAAVAMAG